MGLFGGRKPAERFPIERLRFLPGVLCASIMTEAERSGIARDRAITSKFACGYMMGYPHYVDEIDQTYGANIRQLIFDSVFGSDVGPELFMRTIGLFLAHDEHLRRGWGCGAADGQRYFRALEERKDATGSADSLRMFSQSEIIDFDPQV